MRNRTSRLRGERVVEKRNYRENNDEPDSAFVAEAPPARGPGRPGPSPARLKLSMAVIGSITRHIKASVNRVEGLPGVRGPHAQKIRAPYLECVLLRGKKWRKGDAIKYTGKRWSYLKNGALALEWKEIHEVGVRAHDTLHWFDPELHYITSPLFLDDMTLPLFIDASLRRVRRAVEENDRDFERERVDAWAGLNRCIDTLISRHNLTGKVILVEVAKQIKTVEDEIRDAQEAGGGPSRGGDPFDLERQ